MECGSCGAVIPDDSIFCSECGARQEFSRAGSFSAMGSQSLGGGEVTGGRGFVSYRRSGTTTSVTCNNKVCLKAFLRTSCKTLPQVFSNKTTCHPAANFPATAKPVPESNEQPIPSTATLCSSRSTDAARYADNTQQSDIPQQPRGPTLASGAVPSTNVESQLGNQLEVQPSPTTQQHPRRMQW